MLNYIIMFYSTQGLFQNNNIECMTDNFKYNYKPYNFVQYTTADTDIKEINNTLEKCQQECSKNDECLGFSRSKKIKDKKKSTCWLKKKIDSNNPHFKSNDSQYYTYLKGIESSDSIKTYEINDVINEKIELNTNLSNIHIASNNNFRYKLKMNIIFNSKVEIKNKNNDKFYFAIKAVNKDNKLIFGNSFGFQDELANEYNIILTEIPVKLTIIINSISKPLTQSKQLYIDIMPLLIE